jgi:hypothetical protein
VKKYLNLMAELYEKEAKACWESASDMRNSDATRECFAVNHHMLQSMAQRCRSAAEFEVE